MLYAAIWTNSQTQDCTTLDTTVALNFNIALKHDTRKPTAN